MIPSYGKVYHLGTPESLPLMSPGGPVYAQEKLDGSQLSFGIICGVLHMRSRSKDLDIDKPEPMFKKAVAWVRSVQDQLIPGQVYRGEALCSRKHNVLTYDTAPETGVVLFEYPAYCRLDCPKAARTTVCTNGAEFTKGALADLLAEPSMLGGRREGVVLKRYDRSDPVAPGEPLKVKVVNAEFQEAMKAASKGGIHAYDSGSGIGSEYATYARFTKAVQHLRDKGELTNSPRDIGPLLKELNADFEEECVAEVKEKLWQKYRKEVMRNANSGFAAWYQAYLVQQVLPNG